jgi:5-methyltetrahydropteroyltriglutamate--homocysteine methyltransferase
VAVRWGAPRRRDAPGPIGFGPCNAVGTPASDRPVARVKNAGRWAHPMEIHDGLTSPFPRSEAVVQATRDLDRGRTTPAAVEETFQAAEREVVDLERRLGFDRVTAGYLRWPDLFRLVAERWEGFAVGPLTRWLDTNTFFRQPILLAPPGRVAGAFASGLPPPLRADPARGRVLLPGPYSLGRLLDNRSGETDLAVVHRLGRLLGEEVRELRTGGFGAFLVVDPLLVSRRPTGPMAESVVEAYRSIGRAANGGTAVVWTYGADAVPAFPLLDRLDVSAVGIDLADTEVDQLPPGPEGRGLGLGVLDPRTTLREEPAEIARVVRTAATRRRAGPLWLGPGASLDLLPAEVATRKLEGLASAVAELRRSGR